METKSFDSLELTGGELKVSKKPTNQKPVHAQISQEIKRREKKSFIPGHGKGRFEAFTDLGFEFTTSITREPVFALIEMATNEIDRIKNLLSWAETHEGILSRSIIYIASKGVVNDSNICRYLKITKDQMNELIVQLESEKVVEVTADGSVNVIMDNKSDRVKEEAAKFNGATLVALKKDLDALYEARGMRQSSDEERTVKCDTILKILSKYTETPLTEKSKEVKDLRSFDVLVTKVPNCNFGVMYATPEHDGIKLGHFMFVAYERRMDEKTKQEYWGMVRNPYSSIDWNKHQARLKVIGWRADGNPFKEARKFGVFATPNLAQILPKIHTKLKELWRPVAERLKPVDIYHFSCTECDYTEDGIRYVHAPNASHSILFEGDVRRGLAGLKSVPKKYEHRDPKSGDKKVVEKEIVLTEWIPDDPNQPFNIWHERATKHVVEMVKPSPTA